MDDAFYFTERQISLSDVAAAATRLGMKASHFTHGLQVTMGDGTNEHCAWAEFDLRGAEPQEEAELKAAGVRSAFCVSYHPVHKAALARLLKAVLAAQGGWVGSDDDGFRPRFDASNIDDFS